MEISAVLYSSPQGPRLLLTAGILFVCRNDFLFFEGGLRALEGLQPRTIIRSVTVLLSKTERLEFLPLDMCRADGSLPEAMSNRVDELLNLIRDGDASLVVQVVTISEAAHPDDYSDDPAGRRNIGGDDDDDGGEFSGYRESARELHLLSRYIAKHDSCIEEDAISMHIASIERIFRREADVCRNCAAPEEVKQPQEAEKEVAGGDEDAKEDEKDVEMRVDIAAVEAVEAEHAAKSTLHHQQQPRRLTSKKRTKLSDLSRDIASVMQDI